MRKTQVMVLLLGISLLTSVGCEKRELLPTEQDAQTAL